MMKLTCGDQQLIRTIRVAHEPPAVGADNDRFPRSESYVKDFRPMDFGILELPRGRQELTLQAIEIPGEEAIEFRMLVFRRVTGE